MFRYLESLNTARPIELELSVDETESVTSPFEHFFLVNELKRRHINLASIAPRFVGHMEKGVDYKGDIKRFKEEYLKHLQIAEKLGPYKISIHSGSDKFALYEVIGSIKRGYVHVKTAGTSYLEALRVVATADPNLFREILEFSANHYEDEKRTYHVSANLAKIPKPEDVDDEHLPRLLDQDDVRQVLHVTYGKVLTATTEDGSARFRDRATGVLREYEELHYQYLEHHFQRHIEPFG
jgi:hypothetical protein